LGYRPNHVADTIPGIHLITIAATLTIKTTIVDLIVTTGDLIVTADGRIGMTGTGTGRIEAMENTATIIGIIGTTTLTIAGGADPATASEITVAAGTMTRCWTTKVVFL
jgi:hypothetical protein